MRLVLATDLLDGPGGSETYLVTVAEHLVRLGHQVLVHARRFGPMADRARELGADVATESGLPEECDGVLVQDVGMAYSLAARWPTLPQVIVVHSALFDVQLPPLLPVAGSVAVVLNERVRRRVEAMPLALDVVRLTQPIDTLRFTPQGQVADAPRRALLLGNYLQSCERDPLAQAWQEAGVEVVQAGASSTQTFEVATLIGGFDVVVGKGRAALEAMACGRPTFLYDAFGCDGWVTPANYEALEAEGFSGQSEPRALDEAALVGALADYSPAMGRANRDLVLKHHQARGHAEALVGLFARIAGTRVGATGNPDEELARLSRLRWAAEGENWGLRRRIEELGAELWELQGAREDQSRHVAALTARAEELEAALAQCRIDVAERSAALAEAEGQLVAVRQRLADVRQRLRRQRRARRRLERQSGEATG